MESIRQDLHLALRLFARRPWLTLVAIATLAIGIGATTAIFSVLYAVLLRPLPYPNANRLCMVWTVLGNEGRAPASGPELQSLRERDKLFDQVATCTLFRTRGSFQAKPSTWKVSNSLLLLRPSISSRLKTARI